MKITIVQRFPGEIEIKTPLEFDYFHCVEQDGERLYTKREILERLDFIVESLCIDDTYETFDEKGRYFYPSLLKEFREFLKS